MISGALLTLSQFVAPLLYFQFSLQYTSATVLCHNKPVLKKSPGLTSMNILFLSVINCMIIVKNIMAYGTTKMFFLYFIVMIHTAYENPGMKT